MFTVRGFTAAVVVLAAGLSAAAAAPATAPVPGEKLAFDAVHHALASHNIDAASASADRAEIERAVHLVRTLPSGRREHVAIALEQVAAFDRRLTAPRALTLFGQLKANDDYFSRHYAPADRTDVVGSDGVVYRYFAGRCLEFHPLADFGALNALVAAQDVAGAEKLADALVARGVYQQGGGIGWEYLFSFGGGQPPWLSGMAQAVAAQAFSRAAGLVTERAVAYMREARAAYHAIRGRLLTRVAAGPWIKLYAFDSTPVLNAQLQAVISLQSYAAAAHDPDASALATRLEQSALEMLPRFDTGYWTYYSLAHDFAPLDYEVYVGQLLTKLASTDSRFAPAAARIPAYVHQPPAFMVANGGLGTLRFWLSKPATVTVVTAAGPAKRASLGGGWHTLFWGEPKRPGVYPISATAVDWAGNRASFQSLPIVRVTAAGKTAPIRSASASAPSPPSALSVGAGIDDPSQAGLARALGLRVVRLTVPWTADETAPDPAVVAALQQLRAGTSVIAELTPDVLPVDDAGRAALAEFAAALAQQVPAVHELVLAPAPTTDTAPDYAAAFEAIRSSVQTVSPTVALGAAIDGSQAPKAVVAALGQALAGAPVDVIAFRPAPAAASGEWTTANVSQLVTAVQQSFAAVPPVLLDGVAATSAATYADTITSAACNPSVDGVVLDRLLDAPDDPIGLYNSGGAAKPGAATVAKAAGPAQRGIVVCPGLGVPASASTLTFPTTLDPASPVSLVLGCTRDCLYLVTLEGSDGRPVVARRGSLRGGMPPVNVTLPQAKLKPGTYSLDVRLVNQVNPGLVTEQASPPLSAG